MSHGQPTAAMRGGLAEEFRAILKVSDYPTFLRRIGMTYSPAQMTSMLRNAVRDSVSKGYEKTFDVARLGNMQREIINSINGSISTDNDNDKDNSGSNKFPEGSNWTWDKVFAEYEHSKEDYKKNIPIWISQVKPRKPNPRNNHQHPNHSFGQRSNWRGVNNERKENRNLNMPGRGTSSLNKTQQQGNGFGMNSADRRYEKGSYQQHEKVHQRGGRGDHGGRGGSRYHGHENEGGGRKMSGRGR